jgi:uncharacterized protein with gpF-like domain
MIDQFILCGRAISVLTKYGTETIFSSLALTGTSLISVTKHLMSLDQPYAIDVKNLLDKLDIEAKISVISTLDKDLNIKQNELPNRVKTALVHVAKTLEDLDAEFDEIKKRIDDHELKWFPTWRLLYCQDLLDNIEKHNQRLDKRLDLLFNVLRIT